MLYPNKKVSPKYIDFLFYLFVIIYSSFIVWLAYKINIWEDEAYTLNTTSNKLAKVISQSYGFEGQPPFYFILLSIWRLISPEIFVARLFSIVCIGLSAFVINRIIPLISGFKSPNWIIVIFLLNPFTVWAAMEIRTYALLIFLSTISIYSILLYYLKNKKIYLYYFLLICLIGLYTQYYFVFLIAAITLSLLIYKGWKAFFRLSLYFIPVFILFLPNFYFLSSNIENFQSDDPGYSMMQRFSVVFSSIQSIVLGMNILANMTVIRWSVRIVFLFLVIFSYVKFYKTNFINNKPIFFKYNLLLLATFLTLIFFILFVFITGMKFSERYLAVIFPLIILLFLIFNWQSVVGRNVIYGFISIYFIVLLSFKYSVPIKTYDYQSIAKYVVEIEKPNEAILINSRTISTPFQYYYSGINPLIQLPDTFKFEKEGFQVLLRDTMDLNLMFESIDSNSIVFINDNMSGYSSKLLLNSDILDNYLNTHYYISLDTLLFGKSERNSLRVRRLEDKAAFQKNSLIRLSE